MCRQSLQFPERQLGYFDCFDSEAFLSSQSTRLARGETSPTSTFCGNCPRAASSAGPLLGLSVNWSSGRSSSVAFSSGVRKEYRAVRLNMTCSTSSGGFGSPSFTASTAIKRALAGPSCFRASSARSAMFLARSNSNTSNPDSASDSASLY
jgi:hypothetical protein